MLCRSLSDFFPRPRCESSRVHKMKLVTIQFRHSDILEEAGNFIVEKYQNNILNVNFDKGNSEKEFYRIPTLSILCNEIISGEIVMIGIKMPGSNVSITEIENE